MEVDDLDLVLLTGVGTAYPLVRLHTLLNGLHPLMKHTPLIDVLPRQVRWRQFALVWT
jgi:hypothetical protein